MGLARDGMVCCVLLLTPPGSTLLYTVKTTRSMLIFFRHFAQTWKCKFKPGLLFLRCQAHGLCFVSISNMCGFQKHGLFCKCQCKHPYVFQELYFVWSESLNCSVCSHNKTDIWMCKLAHCGFKCTDHFQRFLNLFSSTLKREIWHLLRTKTYRKTVAITSTLTNPPPTQLLSFWASVEKKKH